jgi:hypothetical protein
MLLIMGKGNGRKRGVVMPVGRAVNTTPTHISRKLQAAYLDQKGQAGDARVIKHSGLVIGGTRHTYQTTPRRQVKQGSTY